MLNIDGTVNPVSDGPPSSFTPINRPGAQPLSPRPSLYLPISKPEEVTNNDRAKLHHPVITQYLGLGVDREPVHLEKYAPFLPPTPTTPFKVRKRTRKVQNENHHLKESSPSRSKKSKHKEASDEFHVTLPAVRRSSHMTENMTLSNVSASSPNNPQDGAVSPKQIYKSAIQVRHPIIEQGPVKLSDCNTSTTLAQPPSNCAVSSFSMPRLSVPSNASSEMSMDVQNHGTIDDDSFEDDELFDSVDINNTIDQCTTNAEYPEAQEIDYSPGYQVSSPHADSPITVCDDDVLSLSTPNLPENLALPPVQLSVVNREPTPPLADHDPVRLAVNDSFSKVQGPSRKFKSPVTYKTEALIRNDIQKMKTTNRKPIVRAPFPDPVRDRSPIIGLSANMVLRTCFRIGEAINQAVKATRNGQNIMFELYARVRSSQRDAIKQYFLFSDLYHDRPPYLKGEYDATLWKPVELFNYDSGRFLSTPKMCRCIGQMKRNNGKEWVMVVLNIWEATWEDIEWVEGIVRS